VGSGDVECRSSSQSTLDGPALIASCLVSPVLAGPPPALPAFGLPSSVLKQVSIYHDFEWRGVALAEVAVVEGTGRFVYTSHFEVSAGAKRTLV
jgi:hypothetical protein